MNSGTACLEYQNEGVPLSRWGRSGGGGGVKTLGKRNVFARALWEGPSMVTPRPLGGAPTGPSTLWTACFS